MIPTIVRTEVQTYLSPPATGMADSLCLGVNYHLSDGGVARGWHGSIGKPGPKSEQLAARLKAAIEAGVAYPVENVVGPDFDGKYRISFTYNILPRMMNAELNRLGY